MVVRKYEDSPMLSSMMSRAIKMPFSSPKYTMDSGCNRLWMGQQQLVDGTETVIIGVIDGVDFLFDFQSILIFTPRIWAYLFQVARVSIR